MVRAPSTFRLPAQHRPQAVPGLNGLARQSADRRTPGPLSDRVGYQEPRGAEHVAVAAERLGGTHQAQREMFGHFAEHQVRPQDRRAFVGPDPARHHSRVQLEGINLEKDRRSDHGQHVLADRAESLFEI